MVAPRREPEELSHKLQQDRIPELKGTATHENLKAMFATDAQASRLLFLFARIAEIEGYREVANVLKEVAESQVFFTDGHVDFLRRLGDPLSGFPLGETVLNLQAAVTTDHQDAENNLPRMARTAHAEGFPDIASWFESIAKAKRAHVVRLQGALELTRKDAG